MDENLFKTEEEYINKAAEAARNRAEAEARAESSKQAKAYAKTEAETRKLTEEEVESTAKAEALAIVEAEYRAKAKAIQEDRLRAAEEETKIAEEYARLEYEKAKKIAEEERIKAAEEAKKIAEEEKRLAKETEEARIKAEEEAYIADLRSRASTAGSNLSTMKYTFRLIELHSYEYDTFKHHGRETATPLQVKRVNYYLTDPLFKFEKDIYLFDIMFICHMYNDILLESDQLSANHRMDRIFKKAIGIKSEPRFDTFVNLDLTKTPILLDILNDEHTKESLEKFKLVADKFYDENMKKWLAAKTEEEQNKMKWASAFKAYEFNPYFGENDYNAEVINVVCELLTKREEYLNNNIIIKNDKGDTKKTTIDEVYFVLCLSDYYNFEKRENLSKELYNYELNKLNKLIEYLTSFSQEEFFKKLEDKSLMDFFSEFIKDNEEYINIINKYVDFDEYLIITKKNTINENNPHALNTFIAKKLGYSIDAAFCSDIMKCKKSDKFFETLKKYNLTLSDVKMMIASADRKLKKHDNKVKKEEKKAKHKSHFGFFR